MKEYTKEQLCLIWLKSCDMLGWSAADQLCAQYGSAAEVWDHFGPDMESRCSKAYAVLSQLRKAGLESIIKQLEDCRAEAIFPEEKAYPEKLSLIKDPPRLLFARGTLPEGPAVAIVGSRRDTRYGKQNAFRIAKRLAENGVTIISGLARGIDTAAHEGAIAGGGKTVAVLGCGVDICYPPENAILLENVLATGGAVISQLAPGSQPLSYHFPLRNRIISGLSDALLLIEARLKSGTNSTVNYALEQAREVFALPGNVDAPGSELPLKLLKEGANLCTDAEDILEYMRWSPLKERREQQCFFDETDDIILKSLFREEKTFEELLEETGMDPAELNVQLTMLEFAGKVEKHAGRTYSIKRS